MIICVPYVVLMVELVVICCCYDCVVHGEIYGGFRWCGREHGCGGVVVLLSWYMMSVMVDIVDVLG